MASPLDILGGLGQIGGLGAIGAYQGEIEGKKLQKDFETRDLENQMRMLRNLQMGQQINQPEQFVHGNQILQHDPRTGQIAPVRMLPQGPPTPFQAAETENLQSLIAGRRREAEFGQKVEGILKKQQDDPSYQFTPYEQTILRMAGALPKPTTPSLTQIEGEALANYMDPRKRPLMSAEAVKVAEAAIRKMQGGGASSGTQVHLVPHPMTGPGGVPYVFEQRVTKTPEGGLTTQYVPIQPVAPKAQAADRETTTESWKITPRKLLTDQETATLNASMPQIVDEISQKPGFNVPGAYVTLPNNMKVRKEELLSRYIKDRLGIEVSLRWDGSKFVVVKAWNPATRERVESVRRTGPPRSAPAESDEED